MDHEEYGEMSFGKRRKPRNLTVSAKDTIAPEPRVYYEQIAIKVRS